MNNELAKSGNSNLDTLGLFRTRNTRTQMKAKGNQLSGTGSEIEPEKTRRWAKRKTITLSLILHLIDIAKRKDRSAKYIKSLWNTYHCLNNIKTSGNLLFARYCKNRFCLNCAAIRKAELINKYLPIVNTWPDPYFVTLTIKAIPAYSLKEYIKNGMVRGFKLLLDKLRKRHERGQGKKIMGIRALECNFNPIKQTYNPHYHIIVPDKETADLLVKEWMLLWTDKHTIIYSQNTRPVKDTEKDLIEVIKYGTKIFTDPSMKKGRKKKTTHFVYISAMDNILNAMAGIHQFEQFGFKVPKTTGYKTAPETSGKIEEWTYDIGQSDWANNEDDNQFLLDFELDEDIIEILVNNIDLVME